MGVGAARNGQESSGDNKASLVYLLGWTYVQAEIHEDTRNHELVTENRDLIVTLMPGQHYRSAGTIVLLGVSVWTEGRSI